MGQIRQAEAPTAEGGNRGFGIFFCQIAEGDAISVVTNGLRFQKITTVMPQELVCTLNEEQRDQAHLITVLTAKLVITMGEGLMFDQVIPSPEPLVEGTDMRGVMTMAHPYCDEDFELLLDDQGRAELQIITLVPVTGAEVAFVREHGTDALLERWEEQEVDALDVYRASAV
nr:suppressor of fused domain protein [Streptomyces sp. SID5468]